MHKFRDVVGVALAAGKGTRMKSDLPKVLHKFLGKSLIEHVIENLDKAGIQQKIAVIGPDSDSFVPLADKYDSLYFCQQLEAKGTADAVASIAAVLEGVNPMSYNRSQALDNKRITARYTLICPGDTPALNPDELAAFINKCIEGNYRLGVIGAVQQNPHGYGRLVTNSGSDELIKIVEQKDCSLEEAEIKLCNTGVIFADTKLLFKLLEQVDAKNAAGEYYLTDIFEIARKKNEQSLVFSALDANRFAGINTQEQLVELEKSIID